MSLGGINPIVPRRLQVVVFGIRRSSHTFKFVSDHATATTPGAPRRHRLLHRFSIGSSPSCSHTPTFLEAHHSLPSQCLSLQSLSLIIIDSINRNPV